MDPLFAFIQLGPQELIIILIIGVLLFGRKLPEVGRFLGKGIVEFRKGMSGIEDNIDAPVQSTPRADAPIEAPKPPQRIPTTAPKFDDSPANVPTQPKA
jgi:sec-independent protein translocase protein TatA